jgi:hypothetical protein
MEAKYYIGSRPQAGGHYYIHREDCPLMPSDEKRIYIGTFLSPEEAAEEGEKHFSNPDYCRFCLKGYNEELRNRLVARPDKKWELIPSIAVIATWEGALVFVVN